LWEKSTKRRGRTKDEQKKNKGGTRGRFHEGDLSVAMARWRNNGSSLRVFENMNRGVATIIEALALAHRATPRVTVSFIFLIWPSSPPPGALSTLAHQFSEPPAPHLINQKLLTPPSAINLKPVTRFSLRHSAKQNPHCCCLGRVEALVVITCQSVIWTP